LATYTLLSEQLSEPFMNKKAATLNYHLINNKIVLKPP